MASMAAEDYELMMFEDTDADGTQVKLNENRLLQRKTIRIHNTHRMQHEETF